MNFLALGIGIFFSLISLGNTKGKLNCTQVNGLTKKQRALCRSVIDPMKAKRNEFQKLDCLGELEDGYQVGICEKVDLKEQARLSQLAK